MTDKPGTGPTPKQKAIEGMFQRAMNLRDSSPGRIPDRLENSYAKAYRCCYRTANDNAVLHFRSLTRNYRKVVRKIAAKHLTKVAP